VDGSTSTDQVTARQVACSWSWYVKPRSQAEF
jgi:hypothetical protein